MRSTVLSLGSKQHQMFPLSDTPGQVEGFDGYGGGRKLTMTDMPAFNFTPPGETVTFSEPSVIEVVKFGYSVERYSDQSKLTTTYLHLKRGATLTGPVAWRPKPRTTPVPVMAPKPRTLPPIWPFSLLYWVVLIGGVWFLLDMLGFTGLTSLDEIKTQFNSLGENRPDQLKKSEDVLVLLAGFLCFLGAIMIPALFLRDKHHKHALFETSRAVIQAPAEKLWASKAA